MWRKRKGSGEEGLSVRTEGILAGTPIATPKGWRSAETLRQGELVLTFDEGALPLAVVEAHPLCTGQGDWLQPHWPLHVPQWALENREELVLLPEQRVLIESDAAQDLYDEPFVLCPASTLLGLRGIDLCRPPQDAGVIRLGFQADQIIYAARGALLCCPELQLELDDDAPFEDRVDYPVLSDEQARALVAVLMAEGVGVALRAAG